MWRKTISKIWKLLLWKKSNTPQNEDNQSVDANIKFEEISKKLSFLL